MVGLWAGVLLLLLTSAGAGQSQQEPKLQLEFEETLGGMAEAMTEIQVRAEGIMAEIEAREDLLVRLSKELGQKMAELGEVQQAVKELLTLRHRLEDTTKSLSKEKLALEEGLEGLEQHIKETVELAAAEGDTLRQVQREVVAEEGRLRQVKEESEEEKERHRKVREEVNEEEERLRKIREEAEPLDVRLGGVKDLLGSLDTQLGGRREELAKVLGELAAARREVEGLQSPPSGLSKVTVTDRMEPLLLPALGVSVGLNVVTGLSLVASMVNSEDLVAVRRKDGTYGGKKRKDSPIQPGSHQSYIPPPPEHPPPVWSLPDETFLTSPDTLSTPWPTFSTSTWPSLPSPKVWSSQQSHSQEEPAAIHAVSLGQSGETRPGTRPSLYSEGTAGQENKMRLGSMTGLL